MLSKRIPYFVLFLLPLLLQSDFGHAKPVSIDKKNFFLLHYRDQVHYPIGVNADFLLNLDLVQGEVEQQIDGLSVSGVNTIRVNIDHAYEKDQPVSVHADGTVKNEVIERIKKLSAYSHQKNIVVVISFFDFQRMVESWADHQSNRINGGYCRSPEEFFTSPQQRKWSSARIQQIIKELQQHDNVIWELGRSVNVDELKGFGDSAWRSSIMQWVIIQLDLIRRHDKSNHLTALSFVPNTMPLDLMSINPVHVFFLHIQSSDPLRAVTSTEKMLEAVRTFNRPVFIGELTWTGNASQSQQFHQWMLWSTLASGSAAFLHTGLDRDSPRSETIALLKGFRFAQPLFDVSGAPRPPAKSKPTALPKDSYHLIESIIGYDWLFCLIRKTPGNSQAVIEIQTQPGWYNYQWFDVEKTRIIPNKSRRSMRNVLKLNTPEFEQILFGRLRFQPEKVQVEDQPDAGNEKR